MSLRITEIRYTRLMIHCNYCARRLCPHGWFKTWLDAEAWALEKGWSVSPYSWERSERWARKHPKAKGGFDWTGIHVCPECCEKQEGRR